MSKSHSCWIADLDINKTDLLGHLSCRGENTHGQTSVPTDFN